MTTHTLTTSILLTLAMTAMTASTAWATDGQIDETANTQEDEGFSAVELAQRFSVTADARVRTDVFSLGHNVSRVGLEFALVEPELGADGPRVDVFAGVGQSRGLSFDAGARAGWEWGFSNGTALALGYDLSVSRDEYFRYSGWYEPSYDIYDPVTLNHRAGIEYGFQSGLRLRVGVGLNVGLAHSRIEQDYGEAITDPRMDTAMADVGIVWRI